MTSEPSSGRRNPSHLFKKPKLRKRLGDPVPCPLDYFPLDEYGCCPACERRMEAEAEKEGAS